MPGGRTSVLRVAVAILVLALSACRPAAPPARPVGAPGHWYTVQAGETLEDLARRAGVPVEDLLEINGLRAVAEPPPVKLVFVLDGRTPEAASGTSVSAASREEPDDAAAASDPSRSRFRWPVEAPQVTSTFGTRRGRVHEGIDLTAPIGTPVMAAGNGEVVYAGGALRGYGNMVVVKHDEEWMTVYAHNSVLLVKAGQVVRAGQRVALSGQSGRATGPHVHFEVRRGQIPRDPLPYLPDPRALRTPRERTPRS